MSTINSTLTLERLKDLLHYDKETGIFRWLVHRPGVCIGQQAGHLFLGYIRIKIQPDGYMAHRLAWFYVYGSWPTGHIDHINRDRSDNRICNLRVVTGSENRQNTLQHADNVSGFKGVTPYSNQRWRATITLNYRQIHLGYFKTAESAAIAYANAAAKIHTCNPLATRMTPDAGRRR